MQVERLQQEAEHLQKAEHLLKTEHLQKALLSLQETAKAGGDPSELVAKIQSLDVSPTPVEEAEQTPDPDAAGAHLRLLRPSADGVPDPANSQPLLLEEEDSDMEELSTPPPRSPVGSNQIESDL